MEFFQADADSAEGQLLLGRDTYTTADYNGCGVPPCAQEHTLSGLDTLDFSAGRGLVATATDAAGNTSEFSAWSVIGSVRRYVALTGSDAGNDCTDAATPCATLVHACGLANTGDTIELSAGTYNEPGLVIDKALYFVGAGVVMR